MSILKHTLQDLHPFILNKLLEAKLKINENDLTNDTKDQPFPGVGEDVQEKKIGFNKRAEYDEEAADEFDDFAVEVGQLYQTMKNKTFSPLDDDTEAIAQQILTLIDKDTEGDLRTQFEELSKLINSLPDKPTEKEKIGFKQAVKEFYMYNKTNKNG